MSVEIQNFYQSLSKSNIIRALNDLLNEIDPLCQDEILKNLKLSNRLTYESYS